jgi:hypothetical protein
MRMVGLGVYLVSSLALVSPARAELPVASTYEDAACDPSDSGECAVEPQLSLAPVPAVPAVVDCSDERLSLVLADMIGTCDMPRRSGPPLPPATVRNAGGPSLRVDAARDSGSCPLRAPARGDDSPSLLTGGARLLPPLGVTPLGADEVPLVPRAEDRRLDRPPRA